MASDELQVLHLVVSRLDAAGFPYMLSGSIALGAYATPRMTRDLDIVVELESTDVERFVATFESGFYCDAEAVRRSVVSRGMVNLIELERVVKVDVIVRKDTPYRRLEFGRRRRAVIDDQAMWIVSAICCVRCTISMWTIWSDGRASLASTRCSTRRAGDAALAGY
jgi:hypothetical protein